VERDFPNFEMRSRGERKVSDCSTHLLIT